jgi:hypothetical protein
LNHPIPVRAAGIAAMAALLAQSFSFLSILIHPNRYPIDNGDEYLCQVLPAGIFEACQ